MAECTVSQTTYDIAFSEGIIDWAIYTDLKGLKLYLHACMLRKEDTLIRYVIQSVLQYFRKLPRYPKYIFANC